MVRVCLFASATEMAKNVFLDINFHLLSKRIFRSKVEGAPHQIPFEWLRVLLGLINYTLLGFIDNLNRG